MIGGSAISCLQAASIGLFFALKAYALHFNHSLPSASANIDGSRNGRYAFNNETPCLFVNHYCLPGRPACSGQDKNTAFQSKSVEIAVFADSGGQQETEVSTGVPAMVQGQVLVKFVEGTDAKQIERIQEEAGIEIIRVASPPNLFLMRIVGGSSVEGAISRLNAYPEVKFAEPNYTRSVKGK